ncbi:MAG: hypothetical protein VXX55_02390, partial [Planctomycetota bacterium]|nr:hypothetical protein [Planctomycetota bacterium]
ESLSQHGLGPTWLNALGKVPRCMRACWVEAGVHRRKLSRCQWDQAEHLIGPRGDTSYNPRDGEAVRQSA